MVIELAHQSSVRLKDQPHLFFPFLVGFQLSKAHTPMSQSSGLGPDRLPPTSNGWINYNDVLL